MLFLIALLYASVGWSQAQSLRVFVVAQNHGTEITDLLVPFALLSAAGADVEIVATESGPVNLMNGLELLDQPSLQQVEPGRADLVIVPAVHHPQEPALLDWLKAAHGSGATVASICDGVLVLAATGLLDGRKATGHFYSDSSRRKKFPRVLWQEDLRFVGDDRVFSTAGVSASAPASIRLVERFIGPERAKSVALAYGLAYPPAQHHDGSQFSVGFRELFTGVKNWLLGLRKRRYNLSAATPVDEYALGLTVDSLGRTFRVSMGVASTERLIRTTHGLRLRGKPAFAAADWEVRFGADTPEPQNGSKVLAAKKVLAVRSSDQLLVTLFGHILREYGVATADLVGLQLELPNRGRSAYR